MKSLLLENEVVYLKDDKMMMISVLFCFVWPRACEILVPQPGIEPMSPALGARSLNYWISRELQWFLFLNLNVQPLKALAEGQWQISLRYPGKWRMVRDWEFSRRFLGVEGVLVLISEFQLCPVIKSHIVPIYNYCIWQGLYIYIY